MTRTAICPFCGKTFHPGYRRQRFCSRECNAARFKKPGPPAAPFAEDWADPAVHRLVEDTISRMRRRCPWLDVSDMRSCAWEAVWRARGKADPDRRYGYYARAVWLRICTDLIGGAPPRMISADSARADLDTDWSPVIDRSAATPAEQEGVAFVDEVLDHLRRRRGERAVDELVSFSEGETLSSIGERYGVTRQAVQFSIRKSRALLKRFLGEDQQSTPDDVREP